MAAAVPWPFDFAQGHPEPSRGMAVVQRFGSALNLNVHVHALVLDGVFTRDATGALAFCEADPPSDEDVGRVLAVVEDRIGRLLDRRGHGEDEDGFAPDAWAEEAPALASMAGAAVLGRVATGPRVGAPVRRRAEPRHHADTPRGRAWSPQVNAGKGLDRHSLLRKNIHEPRGFCR